MLKGTVYVVLVLVCYALAMPTSHDTETLSTTGSLQKAETPNTPAARKQLFAGDSTSADKRESTTAPAGTESLSKFSENAGSSSQHPEDKHVVSGKQTDVPNLEQDDHIMVDEDDKEDDMSEAETIIFRPLFSYRQNTAVRRRNFRDVSINHHDFDYY